MAKKSSIDFYGIMARTVGLGAGATAANMANGLPFVGTLDSRLLAGGKIALGVGLSAYMGNYNKKSTIGEALEGFGDGMAAVGMVEMLTALLPKSVGMIRGIGAFPPMIKGADRTILNSSGIKGVYQQSDPWD